MLDDLSELTGGVLWLLWLAGRRLNLLPAIQVLLGASFTFGRLAVWIMHSHGRVAFAVGASGEYPEELAYGAPVAMLAIMVIMCCPRIRGWLYRKEV